MSDQEIVELVEEAKRPGKFNIINALKDRAYPSDNITVYLDEQAAYLASAADETIKSLTSKLDIDGDNDEIQKELDAAVAGREKLVEKLSESAYVFTITGISEGARSDLVKKVDEKFPAKYNEDKNTFTGEVTRTEEPNEERSEYMVNLIWQSHITKITAPSGDEQDSVSFEDVVEIRRALPIASSTLINSAIEKIRTATAMFMFTVDEDFLAKS